MRGLFGDFEHLIRLAALFLVGIVLFFVARAVFIPKDFGTYGFFRTGALEDNRSYPLVHAGREACALCHDDVVATRAGGAHEGVGCEACHEALAAHAEDPGAVAPVLPEGTRVCEVCHRAAPARPSWFPQVDVEDHAMGETCLTCHDPHRPGFDVGGA